MYIFYLLSDLSYSIYKFENFNLATKKIRKKQT